MRLFRIGSVGLALLVLAGCLDPNIRIVNNPQPSSSPQVSSSASPSTPVLTQVVTDPLDQRDVRAETLEQWIVEYTNQARIEAGLAALRADSRLATVARAHSQNMASQNFFDHRDPQGRTHQNRLDQQYPGLVRGSGENIARYPVVVGSDQNLARRLVDGWLASPGHRANIMRDSFTAIGAGIAQSGDDVYATQVFAMQMTR